MPFSEIDTVYFGAGFEQTKIDRGVYMPRQYEALAGKSNTAIPLTLGWGATHVTVLWRLIPDVISV